MNKRTINKKTRFEVFIRDNFTCQYCGRTPKDDDVVLQVDHIVSVKDGGSNILENLITSCRDCNLGKGKKSINKKTKNEQDIEQELDDVKERLNQLREMNKKREQLRKYELEISLEKMQWINNIIGTGYDQDFLFEIQKIKNTGEYSEEQIEEALKITKEKEKHLKLEDKNDWIKYFNGVLRNMSLSDEEKNILRLYHQEIFINTPMYNQVRKCILDFSDFGLEFHNNVVNEIKRSQENQHGEKYKTRKQVLVYINSESFTIYKSGHNLQVLVCDTLFGVLEGSSSLTEE